LDHRGLADTRFAFHKQHANAVTQLAQELVDRGDLVVSTDNRAASHNGRCATV
jgi:hypothetical protein